MTRLQLELNIIACGAMSAFREIVGYAVWTRQGHTGVWSKCDGLVEVQFFNAAYAGSFTASIMFIAKEHRHIF